MSFALSYPLKWPLLVVMLALFSCSEPEKLEHFDSLAWKQDVNGCAGKREKIWNDFSVNKEDLMGYSENDLNFLLGNANNSHLLGKGQKLYYYHISGSPGCGKSTSGPLAQLQVRVNAVGRVSEVLYIIDEN